MVDGAVPAGCQPGHLLPKEDLPSETRCGLLRRSQPGGMWPGMLVEKRSPHSTSPLAALPWMLPAPDSRSESCTCWHPWPQAGPGLFNPIKNGLAQN